MEKAALLREQRKNGGADNEEQPSFVPQINKRPSYLKQQDSLDKLTVDIRHDSNDIFEQPLPGARGNQAFQNEMNLPKLPSPGSDALGKELKRYPSGPNDENNLQQPAYKSKFLQQYSNELSQDTEHYQSNGHRQNATNSQNHLTPPKQQYEEADHSFMSSLRGNPSSGKKTTSSAGPGWNDDITTSGFAPAPAVKTKTNSARTTRPRVQEQPQQPKEYNNDYYGESAQSQQYQAPAPVRQGRRAVQQQPSRGEWNADTEVIHREASELPTKLTPRASPRGIPVATQRSRPDAAGAAANAAPNLSLLKSKIRRSGSNSALNSTNSAAAFNSTGNDIRGGGNNSYNNEYSGSNAGAAEQVAEIKRSGRRSAPNPSFPSGEVGGDSGRNGAQRAGRGGRSAANAFRNDANEYAEQQMGYQDRYEPSTMTQRPRARDPPQQQQYQQPQPASSRPSYQQQQQQQSQQPPRRGYEEASAQDDPYGADAYPSSSSGMAPDHDEYASDTGEQRECPDCGRKFNPIPYAKHVKICSKVFMQKRKVFDSSKMRMDPEMEKLAKAAEKESKKLTAKGKKKGGAAAAPVPIKEQTKFAPVAASAGGTSNEMTAAENKAAKWKADSDAFRAAMKAARDYTKAKATGAPLPPPVASAPNPHLMPCPHCGRSFSEQAGLRHIPQCQNIKAKPTMLKRGVGGGGGVNGAPTGASNKGKQKGFMG